LFAPFLKIVFPKEAIEVSLEASSEIETEFQSRIVLVVLNHVNGLPRDTNILGKFKLGHAQFLAEFFYTIHASSFLFMSHIFDYSIFF